MQWLKSHLLQNPRKQHSIRCFYRISSSIIRHRYLFETIGKFSSVNNIFIFKWHPFWFEFYGFTYFVNFCVNVSQPTIEKCILPVVTPFIPVQHPTFNIVMSREKMINLKIFVKCSILIHMKKSPPYEFVHAIIGSTNVEITTEKENKWKDYGIWHIQRTTFSNFSSLWNCDTSVTSRCISQVLIENQW